jgi:1-phosphofructokinase family hexose kinase
VIATGLAGGPTGARILELLTEESILNDFTTIAGESRTNLAIIDPTTSEQTEINERGPEVDPAEIDEFIEKLTYLAKGASLCVLAGTLPPSVDPSLYARLVGELRREGVQTLLDTEGEPMRLGLRAEPAIVAPNVEEAEGAVGHEFNDADDLALGLTSLLEMGAREAIITRQEGCVAILSDNGSRHRYEVEIEPLDPVSGVGSGDCFLAGYAAARYEGGSASECLAYGVACGAESTQHFGAGTMNAREAERLLPRVEVREVDVPAGVG